MSDEHKRYRVGDLRPSQLLHTFGIGAVIDHGHLDDFPWHYFVHQGAPCPQPGALRLREHGLSGEDSDILVVCEGCQARRRMSEAFGEEGKRSMPGCRGRQPHLRSFADDPCPEQMKTILLGASNSWFSVTLSALSVPVAVDRLGQLVDTHWHLLELVQSRQNVDLLLQIGQLQQFHGFSADAIWTAITQKRSGSPDTTAPRNLKAPEESFAEMIGEADIPWHLCDNLGADTNYQKGVTGWILLYHQPSDPARAICRMCRRMCSISSGCFSPRF